MAEFSSLKEHLIRWYVMFINGGFGSAREFAKHQGIELHECERMLEIGRKYYLKKQENED